ncbi:ABC transporter ATP-binding protein [Clostridium magnum]|uniref:Macrolide export ATP-binding/permease protein MacB n=1 Tax=Clostridium magnum DSM 2767 TaxID=1121326 RepID=A0A162R1B0_9CLOT|nr:ABC transporter ATP-binding protein [Clostridium magnum]KZL89274.1 macrolide export ATP-binding/permease protein MacB [Clostridium magnum DSM 2767]SHI96472.1 putative ABC transport system ATP-binding protein [Clostridium magnum DSM 2767]
MIEVKNLVKKYFIDTPNELLVLNNINLKIEDGEFVALVGASGSGKSTFMNIIGALDRPTSGEYSIDGIPVQSMTQNQLSEIRGKKIGFVFQTFNLMGRTSALKNVELPMLYAGVHAKERTRRAKELLEMVGMGNRVNHLPNELSGGQKQRVAIARSLVNDPSIILADEPTGALDSKTGSMVMDIFKRVHKEKKKTILVITHSMEVAQMTQRIITIRDGIILSDVPNTPIA